MLLNRLRGRPRFDIQFGQTLKACNFAVLLPDVVLHLKGLFIICMELAAQDRDRNLRMLYAT